MHGGSWDIAPEVFSMKIEPNILPIIRSEREANVIIEAIFAKVEILPGNRGGDHHAGYFQDYNVSTSAAIAFSGNFPELQELLRRQEPQEADRADNPVLK